jgi:hypothetical protein
MRANAWEEIGKGLKIKRKTRRELTWREDVCTRLYSIYTNTWYTWQEMYMDVCGVLRDI